MSRVHWSPGVGGSKAGSLVSAEPAPLSGWRLEVTAPAAPATDELASAEESGLLDRAIQRLYVAGLLLERARTTRQDTIDAATAEVDAAIGDIRAVVFNRSLLSEDRGEG